MCFVCIIPRLLFLSWLLFSLSSGVCLCWYVFLKAVVYPIFFFLQRSVKWPVRACELAHVALAKRWNIAHLFRKGTGIKKETVLLLEEFDPHVFARMHAFSLFSTLLSQLLFILHYYYKRKKILFYCPEEKKCLLTIWSPSKESEWLLFCPRFPWFCRLK